jgi:hypothetical protein
MTKTVLKLSVNIDGKQQQPPASENYVQIMSFVSRFSIQ